ncbi:MAG: type I-E CRISPR-associated protein Cse2/CasB [Candidatus Eisenbacteria sp.]|nr:type I-E CRISPR-associated protein Cse2/CasB [Candidatus Eisenbacteria bacterium]
MSKSEEVRRRAEELLVELEKLKDDRGAMANLRRGLNQATEDRAWPWIARWCDLEKDWIRTIYTTVAAAYATQPDAAAEGNLGATLRRIAMGGGKTEDGLASFESRFRRLLACQTTEEVCSRVGEVMRAAKQKGVPVNYTQLFQDFWWWNGGRPKIAWAAQFWGAPKEDGGGS